MRKMIFLSLICLVGLKLVSCSLPRLPANLMLRNDFVHRPEDDDRIVGGIRAKPNELPYQVSLQVKSLSGVYHHFCGGSLVTSSCVVTAAHCADNRRTSNLYVVAGVTSLKDATPLPVKEIRVNPDYNSSAVYNDIAILKLAKPIIFSEAVKPIAIPTAHAQIAPGTILTVSGWGTTSESGTLSDELLYTEVPVITDAACRAAYGDSEISESMICAALKQGGKDSCQGDSGGPLALGTGYAPKLIGIVSWGYGCARPKYPGVYTEVSYFLNFLKEHGCMEGC